MKSTLVICSLLLVFISVNSCKKDSFITSPLARVSTSADTLTYDTVFTTTGSITKYFKIFNENNQKLKLSKVKLMGGSASAYKMNVDGIAGTEVNDIEIGANDSIYVFVSVTINPNAANLPFIVRDSVLVSYNDNNRYVQLQAYGQNAIFLRNTKLIGNHTWTKGLPYVILGGVLIDTTASLTINPGARIFLHADAPIIVDGRLTALGTKAENIIFRGDRLDPDYKDLPAGWPGIIFRGRSRNNVMRFCQVLNAYQAIVLDVDNPAIAPAAPPKLVLSQTFIDNAYDAGILALNSSIDADNCLISNCGNPVILALGGRYNFTHNTVVSYSNIYFSHTNPSFQLTDYILQNNIPVIRDLTAVLRNNIVWGDFGTVNTELFIDKKGSTPAGFDVTLENNLFKAEADPANIRVQSGNIRNQQPQFDSIDVGRRIYDFHFRKVRAVPQPAIDNGKAILPLTKDLDDFTRPAVKPDIGCFEKQ